jgi:hypothetical protein
MSDEQDGGQTSFIAQKISEDPTSPLLSFIADKVIEQKLLKGTGRCCFFRTGGDYYYCEVQAGVY